MLCGTECSLGQSRHAAGLREPGLRGAHVGPETRLGVLLPVAVGLGVGVGAGTGEARYDVRERAEVAVRL